MATEVIEMIKEFSNDFNESLGINILTKFITIAGAIIASYLTLNELSKKITSFVIKTFIKHSKIK